MSATVNAGGPRLGPIAEVVIATDQLAGDRAVCEHIFGWRACQEEPVPARTAGRWLAPAATGARSVALRPPTGAPGAGIRLVESAAPADVVPLTTYGWAAIEVLVADVDAVAAAVDAAEVEVLGRPVPVGGNASCDVHEPTRQDKPVPGLRAMQVVLPGGAPVYLTEVGAAPPGFGLPRISAGVGGVFIVVVASPNLNETRAFLEATFSLRRVTDHALAVGVLSRAFKLPTTTRHRVSSLQLAGAAAIEIDQYPSDATPRTIAAGGLAQGIAVVELHGVDAPGVEFGPVEGPFGLRLAVVSPNP